MRILGIVLLSCVLASCKPAVPQANLPIECEQYLQHFDRCSVHVSGNQTDGSRLVAQYRQNLQQEWRQENNTQQLVHTCQQAHAQLNQILQTQGCQ